MTIESCLYLLAGMYLMFLMFGVSFYFATARINSLKWSAGNKLLKLFRFSMYVVLLPVGLTCAVGIYLVYTEFFGLI